MLEMQFNMGAMGWSDWHGIPDHEVKVYLDEFTAWTSGMNTFDLAVLEMQSGKVINCRNRFKIRWQD